MPLTQVPSPMLAPGTAGNGPAFSAYANSNQSLSSSTWTKIALQAEEFDTANCFDSTTNYRFTPNVAGYYYVTGGFGTTVLSQNDLRIYKNGSIYKMLQNFYNGGSSAGCYGSCLVYLNGTTDYVEMYGWAYSGTTTNGNSQDVYFQGFLARSA